MIHVATSGCFDLFHAGHLECLQRAKALGDHLTVLLNSDASVQKLKGPSRPIICERERLSILQALRCVDEVVLFDEDTPCAALKRLDLQHHVDYFVKGMDWQEAFLNEEMACQSAAKEIGCHVILLGSREYRNVHTSDIIKRCRL